jgi:type IV pilus assembly protein PilO
MAILDKIDAIPVKQRALIVAVVVLAMVGGFYQFVYKTKTALIQVYEVRLTKLNSELQELRVIKKKLEEFKSMIAELEVQLDVAQKQLPRSKEIPTLLNDISKFGKGAGLEFLSFRPAKENKKGFYAEVPINLVINGPFHNLAKFVDDIVHYPRIIKISSINMSSPKDVEGHMVVRATFKATTFRYLDETGK